MKAFYSKKSVFRGREAQPKLQQMTSWLVSDSRKGEYIRYIKATRIKNPLMRPLVELRYKELSLQ